VEAALAVTGVARQRRMMLIVGAGAFMANLDTSIVNACLPTIAQQFGTTPGRVSLVALSYLLGEVSFLLLFGKLGERWGITQVFLIGFAVFTAGSLLCGLAHSLPGLIAWRAAQGVGGSMMFAVMLAFPGLYLPAPKRAAAMGVLTMVSALGVAVGPPVGGLLTTTLGWNWIFFVNIPIGVAALIAGYFWLPRRHSACSERGLDVIGAALSFVALGSLLLALNMGREWGWGSARILGLFAVALCGAVAFVLRERRTAHPLLDLGLFRSRRFSLATAAFLLAMATTGGVMFVFPFYLQELRGFAPVAAGAILMVNAAGQFAGPWSGRLANRYGTRAVCGAGLGLSVVAFGLFYLLNDVSPLWFIVVSLGLFGVSQGLNKAPNITMALDDVPAAGKAQAGSVTSVARSLGLALGIASFEVLFSDGITRAAQLSGVSLETAQIPHAVLQHGFTLAFLFGVGLSIAALILTLRAGSKRASSRVGERALGRGHALRRQRTPAA
jgi:EmrB/QacA subfamily drug resistance transporter